MFLQKTPRYRGEPPGASFFVFFHLQTRTAPGGRSPALLRYLRFISAGSGGLAALLGRGSLPVVGVPALRFFKEPVKEPGSVVGRVLGCDGSCLVCPQYPVGNTVSLSELASFLLYCLLAFSM